MNISLYHSNIQGLALSTNHQKVSQMPEINEAKYKYDLLTFQKGMRVKEARNKMHVGKKCPDCQAWKSPKHSGFSSDKSATDWSFHIFSPGQKKINKKQRVCKTLIVSLIVLRDGLWQN